MADSTMVLTAVEDLTGGELGGAACGTENSIVFQDKDVFLLCSTFENPTMLSTMVSVGQTDQTIVLLVTSNANGARGGRSDRGSYKEWCRESSVLHRPLSTYTM